MTTREEKNKTIQEEIENEEVKERRKKLAKKIFKVFSIIFISVILFFVYTRYISTSGLLIKEKRIVDNTIPISFNGYKIIHISDLQYGTTIYTDEVNSLVKKINIRKPNIIVFTGDLIDKDYNIKHEEREKLINTLSKLDSDALKYAVSGDEDNDNFTTILNQAGFKILNNEYDLIYNKTNDAIMITGLSSASSDRNIEKSFSYFNKDDSNKNIYNILLMHEADSIDEVVPTYKVNLALAGGNLNGQINIPGVGGIITRKNAKKYLDEYQRVANTSLYISSGVGTDNGEIRLFNRPSINFFRLATN